MARRQDYAGHYQVTVALSFLIMCRHLRNNSIHFRHCSSPGSPPTSITKESVIKVNKAILHIDVTVDSIILTRNVLYHYRYKPEKLEKSLI